MSSNFYNNQLNTGFDIVATNILKQAKFDETLICNILQVDKDGETGKYYVTNGKIQFDAYNTTDKTYKVNDQVVVTIPKGDYTQKKLITGSSIKNEKIEKEVSILDNFIPVLELPSIFNLNEEGELQIENPWELNQALYNPSSLGKLSLIKINFDVEDANMWKPGRNSVYRYVVRLETIIKNTNDIMVDEIIIPESELFGNLSSIYEEEGLKLPQEYLFERENLDIDNISKVYYGWEEKKENENTWNEMLDKKQDKSFKLTFGYNKLNTDFGLKLVLDYNGYRVDEEDGPYVDDHDNMIYDAKEDTNKRAWRLSMNFMDENGNIYNKLQPLENTAKWKIYLLEYDFGSTNNLDEPNWKVLEEDFYAYNATIDFTKRTNQFKAIAVGLDEEGNIIKNENGNITTKIISNPLIFRQKTANDTIVKTESLEFTFANSSNIHNVYNLSNTLETHGSYAVSANFIDANKDKSQKLNVKWKIPKNGTQLTIDENNRKEENGYYVYEITSIDGKAEFFLSEAVFSYSPAYRYDPSNTNNTILCEVTIVDTNEIISGSVEVQFGSTGTTGTQMTFNIYPEEGKKGFNINRDENETMIYHLKLYDEFGDEVDLTKHLDQIWWGWKLRDGRCVDIYANENFVSDSTGKGNSSITIRRIREADKNTENYINALSNGRISKSNVLVARIAALPVNLKGDAVSEEDNFVVTLEDQHPIIEYNPSQISTLEGTTQVFFNPDLTAVQSYTLKEFSLYDLDSKKIENVNFELEYIDKITKKINTTNKVVDDTWNAPVGLKQLEYKNPYRVCLSPVSVLSTNPTRCNIIAKINGDILWKQPIITTIDVYRSQYLNEWNGELTVDEINNTIAAATVIAGQKNSDNTFTGIILGKDFDKENNKNSLYGLYAKKNGVTNVKITEDGDATFAGTITARTGSNIAGWETTSAQFFNEFETEETIDGKVVKTKRKAFIQAGQNKDYAAFGVYVNNEKMFYVDYKGYLFAKNANIQGESTIGSWILDATTLTSKIVDGIRYQKAVGMAPGINTTDYSICKKDVVSIDPDNKPQEGLCFWAGAQYYANSTDKQSIKISGAPFRVYMNGKLYAKNADISGKITTGEGEIGGWIIGSNTLSSTGPFSGGYLKSFVRSYTGNQEAAAFGVYECDENGTIDYADKAHFPGRFYIKYNGETYAKSYQLSYDMGQTAGTPGSPVYTTRVMILNENGIEYYEKDYENNIHARTTPMFAIETRPGASEAMFKNAQCHFVNPLYADGGIHISDTISCGSGILNFDKRYWSNYDYSYTQIQINRQIAENHNPAYAAIAINTDFTTGNWTWNFLVRHNGEINTRGNIFLHSSESDGWYAYSLLSALQYLKKQGWGGWSRITTS